MRNAGKILGVLMVLGGGVWTLQGINILPGSFMTGDPRWALRGAVVAVVGIVLIAIAGRRGPRANPPPTN